MHPQLSTEVTGTNRAAFLLSKNSQSRSLENSRGSKPAGCTRDRHLGQAGVTVATHQLQIGCLEHFLKGPDSKYWTVDSAEHTILVAATPLCCSSVKAATDNTVNE